MKRISPIAGTGWYKGDEEALRKQITNLFADNEFGVGKLPDDVKIEEKGKLLGVISPHAGYRYSGSTATHSYLQIRQYYQEIDLVIIIGPNHRGIGPSISIYPEGSWETPLGEVPIDEKFNKILRETMDGDLADMVEFEIQAHRSEHSIEIQLPILQYMYKSSFSFVPICIAHQDLNETSRPLSKLLRKTITKYEQEHQTDKIVIVASSDLSHEQSKRFVEQQDKSIIEAFQSKNLDTIEEVHKSRRVTMCGYGAIYTLLGLAELISPDYQINTLSYTNSGEITGLSEGYTVGYYAASILV